MSASSVALAPCGIRHVRMNEAPESILAAADERAVLVVFWRDGRALGSRVLLAAELPVPASAVPQLAAEATAEAALESSHEAFGPHGETPPSVSVVVCTRDRPDDLRRCLTSIVACTPPPFEIIVVDNAPIGDLEGGIRAIAPGARYLREPRPGLSHARNVGAAVSAGQVVAFTDDDVEVPSDWVARVAAVFRDPAIACLTGQVLAADLSGPAACHFECAMGGLGRGFVSRRFDDQALYAEWWRSPRVWDIGAGANMAVRREIFFETGLFDPRLGAGASGCSEDSEFWFRVLRSGHVCRYEPAVVVFHHHRPDWPALERQLQEYARGHVAALCVQFAQDNRVCHLIRIVAMLPWHYVRVTMLALILGDRASLGLVLPQVRGYLYGLIQIGRWWNGERPPRLADAGRETVA